MIVERQAVIDWLNKKNIYYVTYEETILLPDRSIALRLLERDTGLSLIRRKQLENEGWLVVDLSISDLQTRLEDVLTKALEEVV